MKSLKRTLSILLAVMLVMAMSVTAFAAGDGTITITNATVDKIYNIYKIFDATVGANDEIAYTYNGTFTTEQETYFTKDASGNVTATAAAKDANGNLTTGAIAVLAGMKGAAAQTKTATSVTVEFTNLDYGYYYVESSLGSAVTVTSTNPDAIIIDKNQKPHWPDDGGKVIVDASSGNVTVNDVAIGETLTFNISVDATNFDGQKPVTAYFINDKMPSGITFNDDVKVKVNGIEIATSAYTIEKNTVDGYTFKINIPWYDQTVTTSVSPLYSANSKIVVSYTGTVNASFTTGANKNEAEFDYATTDPGTPPVNPPTTPDPGHDIPKSSTESYTAKIQMTKVDGQSRHLTGAKFSISGTTLNVVMVNNEIYEKNVGGDYWRLKDGTYTTDDPATHDATQYDSTTQKYERITVVTKDTDPTEYTFDGWVDSTGVMTFHGLSEGTYEITELVSPEGYNLLTAPVKVVVTFDETSKTFSAFYSIGTGASLAATVSNGVIGISVTNLAGTVLPGTGGIGTTIFYILGGILVLGAAVVIITRKRMSNEA